MQRCPLGPTGLALMRNIAGARVAQNLTYAALSSRLTELGRPIPALGLSRIERGERRVDADDLMALGRALGIEISALLGQERPEEAILECRDFVIRVRVEGAAITGAARG